MSIAIDDSIEALLVEHGTASRTVYLVMLVTTIAAVIAAAITSIDLTIRAPATLSASIDRQTLRSGSDGLVARVSVSVGSHVRAGDTLVALSAETVQRALAVMHAVLATQRQRKTDLQQLASLRFTGEAEAPLTTLRLEQSRAAARAADVEWQQGSIQVTRADKARDRQARLMEKGFAVPAELEAAAFEAARAREERSLALERRRSEWAEELALVNERIGELERDVVARTADQANRYITTPVSGTVEELMPITAGSLVRAGDAIATISPEGTLVADALVSPKDVAYLHTGMPARLIIDGYNVNEWGGADAVVTTVAHDFTLADGHPVFRVRMQPTRADLRRANGTVAPLGKGLRGQARFLLGKKRLAQLLTHRAREWFDPASADVH